MSVKSVYCRSRPSLPPLTTDEWKRLDQDLKSRLAPLHHDLANDLITAKVAGKHFVEILTEILESEQGSTLTDLISDNSEFFQKQPSKTLQSVTKLKNKLRKKAYGKNGTAEDKKLFRQAVKAHNQLKRIQRRKETESKTRRQEKMYLRDFWNFAKKCATGCLDKPAPKPSFSLDFANQYYHNAYSVCQPIDKAKLSWFPRINVDTNSFNFDPVRPKHIKGVLQRKKSTSAPGSDGIMYGILQKLPSSHHFLATLFSKLLHSADPPVEWSSSVVTLIHKNGSTDDPKNFRMIALTSCIGKLHHQILAERIEEFAIQNGLINPEMQKAFLKGISGCIENNQVLHELVRDAKGRSKTIHITFFDLQDAFGSIEHELIHHVLEFYAFPTELKSYIKNLYSRLEGQVRCPQGLSSKFEFRRGVFQGDPLSPIIFLLVFNPVLKYLQSIEDQYGYNLNGTRYISVPFADDFNLITGNKRTHQRIMNDIAVLTSSMNLTLKQSKCCSLSICRGSPTEIEFVINGNTIHNIREKPEKFLGSWLTFHMKSDDAFSFVRNKLVNALECINSTHVRNEFKIAVLTRYSLPSLRYVLTVHDLTNTQLSALDGIVTKQIKEWLNIPAHGASPAILHSRDGLQFKTVSELYKECHVLAHASSRLGADDKVQNALDSKVLRESKWSKKMSLCNAAVCEDYVEKSKDVNLKVTQSKLKKTLCEEQTEFWRSKVEPLVFQGDYLKLVELESGDLTWRSIIFNLPKGVLSFITRAAINALPTADNLRRWGKKLNTRCKLCGNHETLLHILNNCKRALEQERYNFRHDSIIKYIMSSLLTLKPSDSISCYADLRDHMINGGTVPPDILPTVQRPDLVIVNSANKSVMIGELTVPFETNITSARERKCEKYSSLVQDIISRGFSCKLVCFEIGSRGLITKENKRQLTCIFKCVDKPSKMQIHFKSISKIAILTSYAIYNARNQPTWTKPPYLQL